MKNKRLFIDALIVFALIAVIAYVIVRTTLFIFAEYSPVEKFFAIVLILGEMFVLLHGMGYVLNIFRVTIVGKTKVPVISIGGSEPSVAVLVAARHEPKEILENTFITLQNMNYKNKKIYFLDDSTEAKYKKEAEDLRDAYGFVLFRSKVRHGAKAGIINDCLRTLNEKYIVIFDADQNPMPDFLKILVPIMEGDTKLSFVQTPQFYTNIEDSPVARGSAFQQAVFYEYICEGKATKGAMFCCGTNVIFRREALMDVGGLDESTVTEDFATSIKLHAKGWKSLYYNHVYAFGMGPESLLGYFKQQFRWATGTIEVFKKLLWKFLNRPFSFRLTQWWEYFLSSSYYLIGIAFFILMICPIIYILFKVPSFFAEPEIYFLAFMPYIMLSMSVFYIVLGTRNYKMKDLFLGQLLSVSAFSVYIRGALSAIIGIKVPFGVTEKSNLYGA
jgi:cellulose synthase (UDP-forming)